MNPWVLIPKGLVPALKAINNLQLLDNTQWRHRLETHPFPSINLTPREIRETVISAQLRKVPTPLCWVDAGTGRCFRGAFPMTGFDIAHPSEEPLEKHQGWLRRQLQALQDDYSSGHKRAREWEVLLAVPLLDDNQQWNKLLCYGAYGGMDHHRHGPLRPW